MTEPTADVPTAPERDDLTAAPRESSEPTAPEQPPAGGPSGQGEQVDGGPAPAIIVLTEEALKPVDVDKIIALHQDEAPTYRVLVPADTDRNMLSEFLDHLSLFEMREALDAAEARSTARRRTPTPHTALATTLAELEAPRGGGNGGDHRRRPLPTLARRSRASAPPRSSSSPSPHAVEDTFHTDWASKARETLGVPVLHMYAGDWRLG